MLCLEGERCCGRANLSFVEIGFEVVHNNVWIGTDFRFWGGTCLYESYSNMTTRSNATSQIDLSRSRVTSYRLFALGSCFGHSWQ